MRLVAVAALTIVAVPACSSSSSSTPGKSAYLDATMRSFDQQQKNGKVNGMSRSQARCVVSTIVDKVGVDKLKKEGYSPNDFEHGNKTLKLQEEIGAKGMLDIFKGCGIDVSKLGG